MKQNNKRNNTLNPNGAAAPAPRREGVTLR